MWVVKKVWIVMMIATSVITATSTTCDDSDSNLLRKKEKICASLVQGETSWCGEDFKNVTAHTDWPNQAVYMEDFLDTLISPETCLNTTVAADLVSWLDNTQSDANITGNFAWTWDVFQVQYYDMPRKPGTRIESPDTLGRKCWAFAYLTAKWQPDLLQSALSPHNLSVAKYISMSENSIPLTMGLCEKAMANCFENSTYTPSRNGTCSLKIADFHYLGFDRENLKRHNVLKYPFY